MKKLSGIVLALLGVVLAAAGVAGVVLIGSDNVVGSPASTLKVGEAKAVVSTPGLLAYKDTTLQVTAENSGGSVFIGRAHPVDATSYLGQAPTFAVTKVDSSGVSGEAVKGSGDAKLADPTKQTFWTDTAAGTGTQTLDLELDGSPTEYVIMPLGETGELKISSGFKVDGGFALSIGAIVVGLLALVAGVLLLRRGGRSAASPERAAEAAASTRTATSGSTVANDPRATGGQESSRTAGRVVTGVAVFALVPTLGGCGFAPTKVEPWKNSEVTKPASTTAEATAMMEDYDVRNNAAIKGSHESYQTDVWNGIDDGVVLSADVYATRHAQATKDKSSGTLTTKVGPQVYAPAFGSYPMYTLVDTTQTWNKDKPNDVLVAMARMSASAPWVKVAGARVKSADLPKAQEAGAASSLTPADEKAAVAAMKTLQQAMNAGKGAGLTKEVTDYLALRRKKDQHIASSTAAISPWVQGDSGQVSPRGSIQSVKTKDGQLALMTYQVVWTRTGTPGAMLSFADRNYAKTVGQTGSYSKLTVRTAVTLGVTIDAKGTPKVIGQSFYDLT